MRELKFDAKKDRKPWLEARRKIITATDMPAILGVSPYAGALAVYESKVVGDTEVEESERMRFGRRLQPAIIEEYSERTGRPANDHGIDISLHPSFKYIGATLDADQKDPSLGEGALEIKTTEWIDEDEEPPLHWQVQLQHQLMTARLNWGTIACLVKGNKLVWWDLKADPDLHRKLEARAHEFWQQVQRQIPPDADGTDADAAAIKSLYPREVPEKTITLGVEALPMIAGWEQAKAELKRLTKAVEQLKQQIQVGMGDAELALLPDGSRLSWKTQERKGYTVQPSSTRVLRHLKGKSK